jgi:hypothetical protein
MRGMASRFWHVAPWLAAPLVLGGLIVLWSLLARPAPQPGSTVGVPDHVEAATGLCHAIGLVADDRDGAVRAFTDEAHLALHALASDQRLQRSLAAELLQAKYAVEADLSAGASGQPLYDDLLTLYQATVAALDDIGAQIPACDAQ